MERAGLRQRTFDGVRVRHVSPGLARAALWLALVCASAPFLPELLARGSALPSTLLALTRGAASWWLAGAAACVVAAWLAARGVTEAATVLLDARCLYVATRRRERRTPLWMIEHVVAVPPLRREVRLHLTTGRTVHLVLATPAQARGLTDALAAPAQRRRARSADPADRPGEGRIP
jgi:hypothetical protein